MLCPKSSSSCSFLRLNSTLNNSGFFLVLSPCLISPPALKPKLFHVFGRPYYTVITVERARSLPWGRVMLKLVPGQKIKKKKERERERFLHGFSNFNFIFLNAAFWSYTHFPKYFGETSVLPTIKLSWRAKELGVPGGPSAGRSQTQFVQGSEA